MVTLEVQIGKLKGLRVIGIAGSDGKCRWLREDLGFDAAVAKDAFVKAQSELLRAVSKGVVHKNTASRKVSRLAHRIGALAS